MFYTKFLIIVSLILQLKCSDDTSCDVDSKNCGNDKSYPFTVGNCEIGTNGECLTRYKCQLLENSAFNVCINPGYMIKWNVTNFSEELLRYATFNGESDALCLTSVNNGIIYDDICKKLAGECDEESKKCIISDKHHEGKVKSTFHGSRYSDPYKYDEFGDEIVYDKKPIDLLIGIDSMYDFETFQLNWNDNKELSLSHNPRDDQANWKSHIANFYYSYYGFKFYYHGVSNIWIELTKKEIDTVIQTIENDICEFFNYQNLTINDVNIDFVGYDRGGYLVMQIIQNLTSHGCFFNDTQEFKTIKPRFVGLYAPTKSHFNTISSWYNKIEETTTTTTTDTSKLNDASQLNDDIDIVVAYGDPNLYTRQLYDIYDVNTKNKKYFKASHGAMGCAPDGCKEFYWIAKYGNAFNDDMNINYESDIQGCIAVDTYIRQEALKLGVPITPPNQTYYNRFMAVI